MSKLISPTSPITSAHAHWRDYVELCKPKVVALLLITALVGMHLATNSWVPLNILIAGTLGIGLAAAAAAVVNHIVDRHRDRLMKRTEERPIATGRVTPKHALVFAIVLGSLAMFILLTWVNALTAWLTLASLIGYAFIYTLYLKRATPQNIVIGGLSGAAPPLLGWTAVTGSFDAHALLLVLIVYTWTPPHFWALAIHRHADYARADIPMLPVTHGIELTKTCVLLYTILLILATLLPYLVGMSHGYYLIGALLLGAGFMYYAVKLKYRPAPTTAIKTFAYSIHYLLWLFICLLVDHYLA